MHRVMIALFAALALAGCHSSRPRSTEEAKWGANLRELEDRTRAEDNFDLRCLAASQYLTFIGFPGLEKRDQLESARRALMHAEAAIRLDDERVEGHYYRAVAIGYVLDKSTLPDLDLIEELEDAGLRARELDASFNGAGPLRLLAMLYWQAPPWPVGPEDAGDDEVIDPMFRESIRRAPGCSENHVSYAEYLEDRGRSAEAVEHARKARVLLDDDPIATPFDRPDLKRRIEVLLRRLSLARPQEQPDRTPG